MLRNKGGPDGHQGDRRNARLYGMAYVKQTESAYMEQVRERQEKQLQRRAQELALYVAEDGGGGVAAGGIGAG